MNTFIVSFMYFFLKTRQHGHCAPLWPRHICGITARRPHSRRAAPACKKIYAAVLCPHRHHPGIGAEHEFIAEVYAGNGDPIAVQFCPAVLIESPFALKRQVVIDAVHCAVLCEHDPKRLLGDDYGLTVLIEQVA
ncbi:MAG TPA: hypothetical protein IAB42_01690 [Candidatus Coproplasma avistercoris]|nr:hypothetical protein [Candidatus Coproplasma avistercoris]